MISIIIPAYNSAATIEEALDSVMSQTLWSRLNQEEKKNSAQKETKERKGEGVVSASGGNNNTSLFPSFPSVQNPPPLYEVIIVDDCSTDNTAEVVQNWIAHHTSPLTHHSSLITHHSSLITLHILPKNGGPALARNKGIEEAHGEWIAFLDADDIWLPHKLEFQMRLAAEHPEVAMWCGSCIGFANAETLDPRPKPALHSLGDEGTLDQSEAQKSNVYSLMSNVLSPVTLETLALHNPIATSTVLVKREVLLAAGGFDPQFRGPEDYDLWLRVAAYGEREEKRIEQKEAKETKERILDSAEGGKYNSSSLPLFPSVKKSSSGIVHVAESVSRYRQVPGSLSMDDRKFLPQVLRVLEKAFAPSGVFHDRQDLRRKARANQYWHASWMAFQRGSRIRAIRLLARAVFLNPFVGGRKQLPLWWRYVAGRP
jgi:glycosyltransferase involved in cell wall biosynthesis